jgi:hypothetical protein
MRIIAVKSIDLHIIWFKISYQHIQYHVGPGPAVITNGGIEWRREKASQHGRNRIPGDRIIICTPSNPG